MPKLKQANLNPYPLKLYGSAKYLLTAEPEELSREGGVSVETAARLKEESKKIDAEKGGLAQLVNTHKAGDVVQVEIWRDGKSQILSVNLVKAGE